MLKFFTNLIFIIMLFMLMSGMPLNLELLEINPFKTNIETPSTIETQIYYSLSEAIDIAPVNPTSFSFDVSVTGGNTLTESFLNSINIIFKHAGESTDSNEETEDTYPLSSLSYEVIPDQAMTAYTVTVNLSSVAEAFESSRYSVIAESDYENNHITSSASFNYYALGKSYLGASDSEIDGKFSMTLYFPTEDQKYLIPISRRVDYPENRARTLYRNLYAGPADLLGLPTGATLPYASKIYITQGLASIYIYSPEQNGYEDSFDQVIEMITNSMSSLGFVDRTIFYINDSNESFGNMDLTQIYTPAKQDIAYLGYSRDSNYLMLLPVRLDLLNENNLDKINWIMDILKGTDTQYTYTDGIVYPIPETVNLIDYTLDDNQLTLNFSTSFIDAFDTLSPEDASTYAQLVTDSLRTSYTSLDNVDSIVITVEGQNITDYYGIDLSLPLYAPQYMNMEP